jgi:GntR family transcriptional regulator/MocR family aminotransferase
MGKIAVAPGLSETFLAFRASTDHHVPILEQATVADFIAEGHFTRHIRRMRTLYATRREILLAALSDLPLDIDASETGMHLVGWLPENISDQIAAQRALDQQVRVLPVSTFAMEKQKRGGLVLGYSAVDAGEIQRGAIGLARVLDSFKR